METNGLTGLSAPIPEETFFEISCMWANEILANKPLCSMHNKVFLL